MSQSNYTTQQQPAAVQPAAGKPGPKGIAITDNRAATVQRMLMKNGEPCKYQTFKSIMKDQSVKDDVEAVARLIKNQIGGEVNQTWFETSWNDQLKNVDYDIDTNQADLVRDVTASYWRSAAAGNAKNARTRDALNIAGPLTQADPDLKPVMKGREMIVEHDHPHQLDAPQNTSFASRVATHASTLVLAENSKGVEVQIAMQHNGKGMLLSSNKNAANNKIRGDLKFAKNLKELAAQYMIKKNVIGMPLEQVMSDRILRHTAKLFLEIASVLSADAPVKVPLSVAAVLDGMHAEIRIHQDEWTGETHLSPSGSKLPCMGCYIYFAGERILLGKWMGPLWLSNPGIAKQIEELLLKKGKFGKFGPDKAREIGETIAEKYSNLPNDCGVAHSRKRDGKYTTAHDPDSDPEMDLDDEEYAILQQRLTARQAGEPKSPEWQDSDTWVPFKSKRHKGPLQKGTPALDEEQVKKMNTMKLPIVNFVYGKAMKRKRETTE